MLEKLINTYRGKTVLVTGHTGFKGTWLTHVLHFLGAKVIGFALPPENDQPLFDMLKTSEICNHNEGDIRDFSALQKLINDSRPDFIFHLAAQPLVLRSYKEPRYTYETNVMGTVNVLESLRNADFKSNAIIITTDKVYENLEKDIDYKESDRLGGFDPYSNSKACAELVTASFRNSFFPLEHHDAHKKSIATVRSGNVIGGGDWSKNRIIPDLVRSLEKNEKLIIRNPTAVRPWQHVLDPLNGYLLLGCKMEDAPKKFSSAFNFGPSDNASVTVEELIKLAINVWGSGFYEVRQDKNQPHEANLLRLSPEKAKKELNWMARYDARKAIEKTIQWYKMYPAGAIEITKKQIKEYYQ